MPFAPCIPRPPRLLPVSDAPGRLRAVRRWARRAGAVGGGDTPADDHLRVVLGAVGEASELAGGGGDLSDHLGQRVPRGVPGRRLGPGAPGSDGIAAVGIDEIQWQRGHRYLTLVYQIDPAHTRLRWIGQTRRVKTLLRFFRWFGRERTQALRFICSDMWQPYLTVVAKKAGHALHVLDRFHIALNMNTAIDTVRRAEVRALKQRGRPAWLTKTRWLLLRRRGNRTATDRGRRRDLVRLNLKAVRSMLLREDFDPFWRYRSAHWAGLFLDRWCTRVMRSRIDPMKKGARSLRTHRALLVHWCTARGQISTAAVEGLNTRSPSYGGSHPQRFDDLAPDTDPA